jgi:hypothetical protein
VLVGTLIGVAGGGAPWSFILAGILAGLTELSYAELGAASYDLNLMTSAAAEPQTRPPMGHLGLGRGSVSRPLSPSFG